ncbi:MAG: hypothetical protein ABI129_07930 [Rhodanobacter sp.]
MLHKFGRLPHTATVPPMQELNVKLAAVPDAVKQRRHAEVAKSLSPLQIAGDHHSVT